MNKLRMFSLEQYIEAALQLAEYERDEDGGIIARVPDAAGFFSQGDTFEEARENLRDAIEGNVLLALQRGYPIPVIKGVTIEEYDAQTVPA
jgi:predicted RNase H-like HicB family nuclease